MCPSGLHDRSVPLCGGQGTYCRPCRPKRPGKELLCFVYAPKRKRNTERLVDEKTARIKFCKVLSVSIWLFPSPWVSFLSLGRLTTQAKLGSLLQSYEFADDLQCYLQVGYRERTDLIARFAVRSQAVAISCRPLDPSIGDASSQCIDLRKCLNVARDDRVATVRRHIGRGVQLRVDHEGNLFAHRLGKNPVWLWVRVIISLLAATMLSIALLLYGLQDYTSFVVPAVTRKVLGADGQLPDHEVQVFDIAAHQQQLGRLILADRMGKATIRLR